MAQFKVDPGIESLLPKLTPEEYAELKRQIETDGHVDPGVVALCEGERILADGHHRLRICETLHIPFPTRTIKIPSREVLIRWVKDYARGRRNLTPEQYAYLRGTEYLEQRRQEDSAPRNTCASSTGPVANRLAEKHGVSPRTIQNDAAFAQAVDTIGETDPAAKDQILTGTSGKTRQEVIETTRPVPESKPRRRRAEPSKNGAPKFEPRQFTDHLGGMVRALDSLAKAYGLVDRRGAVIECPEHKAILAVLKRVQAEFDSWHSLLKKAAK